jgi:predicted  nucleic acid-binding Zn-ribbon protein
MATMTMTSATNALALRFTPLMVTPPGLVGRRGSYHVTLGDPLLALTPFGGGRYSDSMTTRRPSRLRWRTSIGAALLLPLLPVATSGPVARRAVAAAQVAPHPAKMDEFLVVDCLLPGQVRRLGSKLTMLTARRAMKTSQRDCEIRGGEYVSFDRANYATALKVWLPLAEGGDNAAQTYVGEIYEKGLGVPPDYAVAAQWYRRAADKGYPRAAVNLGHLYEHGLGVPRDPGLALSFYQRAAGQTPLSFEIAPSAETAGELQRLRSEIADLRRQLETRQQRLDRAQGELDTARRVLEQRRTEVDDERAELGRLRMALNDSRAREQAATTGQRDLERAVAEREGKLALREREGRADAERQRAAIERERAELARLRKELDDSRSKERTATAVQRDLERAVAEREARFAARERELAERNRADAERQRAETDRERAELARLRKELQDSRSKERTATTGLGDLERAVVERETRLGAKEREIADLRAAVSRTEADSAARRAALEREAAGLRASLAKLEAESSAQRAASRPAPQPQAKAPEAPPLIELIEPELVATRDPGIQSAHLTAPASSVVVLGRVQSAGGLKSLTVNGREETVDPQNLFKAQVAVRNAEDRVRIVAVDRAGRKSTLEFLLVDPGSRRAGGGGDETVRIGHAKAGTPASFGNYH